MGDSNSVDIKRALTRKCAALGIPVSGIFELTPRCNLRCKMCYIRMTEPEMKPFGREKTADEWISLAKEAVDAGMLFLLITGGEPLIRADFPKIYEELMKMGLSISINTNGTLIDDKIKGLWRRLPPAYVNITLYGTTEEEYEKLCGDKNAFHKVVSVIEWLQNEGIIIHLNATMTPYNYGSLKAMENFAASRNIALRMTPYCFPPVRRGGDGCTNDFSRLSAEKAGELTAFDIFFREGEEGIKKRLDFIDTPINDGCEYKVGDTIKCLAGHSQFWVTWNGVMTPCGMMNEPQTKPFENGFLCEWEKLKNAVQKITLCSDCANCSKKTTCMSCAAVMLCETGGFEGKPQYLCRMNDSYRETVKKISEKAITFSDITK